jgi:hypothetical protein
MWKNLAEEWGCASETGEVSLAEIEGTTALGYRICFKLDPCTKRIVLIQGSA